MKLHKPKEISTLEAEPELSLAFFRIFRDFRNLHATYRKAQAYLQAPREISTLECGSNYFPALNFNFRDFRNFPTIILHLKVYLQAPREISEFKFKIFITLII